MRDPDEVNQPRQQKIHFADDSNIKTLSIKEHMKLRPGFYARLGITLTEFDEAPEGLEFTRAGHETECPTCKKIYQWHNVETYGKDPSMQLVLHVLCNGKRVKL